MNAYDNILQILTCKIFMLNFMMVEQEIPHSIHFVEMVKYSLWEGATCFQSSYRNTSGRNIFQICTRTAAGFEAMRTS